MKVEKQTSEIFILVMGILVSLFVLLIFERYIVNLVETKKKTNVLYYKRFFDNINRSKIVLNVLLFTILIILINPFKLLGIFNPFIFNIFDNKQFKNIIDFIKNTNVCNDFSEENFPEEYIQNKPYNTIQLDKTLSETIFNKSDASIYNRILKDFNNNKKNLCNLSLSIDIDNILSNPDLDVKSFDFLYKQIQNKALNNSKLETSGDFLEFFEKLKNNSEDNPIIEEDNPIIEYIKQIFNDTDKKKKFDNIINVMNKIKNYKDKNINFNLDENRISKFSTFNRIINNNRNTNKNTTNNINEYLDTNNRVSLLASFLLFDTLILVFSIFFKVRNRLEYEFSENKYSTRTLDKSFIKVNDRFLVRTDDTTELNGYFIVYNLIILVLIITLFNDTKWLSDAQLDLNETKKYIMFSLFSLNIIPKLIYKYNKAVTFDTFLLINTSTIFSNIFMSYYILKYFSYNNYEIKYGTENPGINDIKTYINKNETKFTKLKELNEHIEGLYTKLNKGEKLESTITIDLLKKNFKENNKTELNKLIENLNDYGLIIKKPLFSLVILFSFAVNDYYMRHYFYKNYKGDKLVNGIFSYYFLTIVYILVNLFNLQNTSDYKFIGFAWAFIGIVSGLTTITTISDRGLNTLNLESLQNNDYKLYRINKAICYPFLYFLEFLIPESNLVGITSVIAYSVCLPLYYYIFEFSFAISSKENIDGLEKFIVIFGIGFYVIFAVILKAIFSEKGNDEKLDQNNFLDYINVSKPSTYPNSFLNVIVSVIVLVMLVYFNFRNPNNINEVIEVFGDVIRDNFYKYCILVVLVFHSYWLSALYMSEWKNIGSEEHNKKVDATLYYIKPLLLVFMILAVFTNRDKSKMAGGGEITSSMNSFRYIIIALVSGVFLYKLFTHKRKIKKVKGGTKDEYLEIKQVDNINSNLINISLFIILTLVLYNYGLLYTSDISDFITNTFLNYANINKIRLLVFPFIVIAIFFVLFGYKTMKSFLIRQIEKSSIYNIEKNNSSSVMTSREKKLVKKFTATSKSKADILSYENYLTIKYTCIFIILGWYSYLIFSKEIIEIDTILFINIAVLYVYIYFIQYVLYIFYKIYINENVNKIEDEIKKINKIKTKIKFTQGKVNPVELEEIIEINTSKLKVQFEEFMNTIYGDINGLLAINNIYLTSAIEIYIKRKLITHKPLEEEFNLKTSIEENRKIELEKRKKLGNESPLAPIPENIIMKLNLTGKWTNMKDDNNIILYVYNNIGIVIYFNKKQYQGLKITNIVQKSGIYEFIYNNELEFTYDNKNIIMNNIPYSKLSTEFSTDNIIKKTLRDNDVFKSLNYMITIDEDAKYIGKYNIIENLTKYNVYKQQGDPLTDTLEQLIMNKILLIKSIKSKKYKEANTYNKVIQALEKDYKNRETYYKFDSNRDGTIDLNEVEMYASRNHKLSDIGEVKVVSATYHGGDIHLKFDKSPEVPISSSSNDLIIPTNNVNDFAANDLVVFNNDITDKTASPIVKVYANKIYKILTHNSGNGIITLAETGISNSPIASTSTDNGYTIPPNTSIKKVQYKSIGSTPISIPTGGVTLNGIDKHFNNNDFVICDRDQTPTSAAKYALLKINITSSNTFTLSKVDDSNTRITNVSANTKIIKVNAHEISGTITTNTIPLENASSIFSVGDIVIFNTSSTDTVIFNTSSTGINQYTEFKITDITSRGITLSNLDNSNITISGNIPANTYIYTYKNNNYDFPLKLNNISSPINKIVEKIDSKTFKIELIDDKDKDIIEKKSNNKITLGLNLKNKKVKLYKTTNNFAEFDPTIFDP